MTSRSRSRQRTQRSCVVTRLPLFYFRLCCEGRRIYCAVVLAADVFQVARIRYRRRRHRLTALRGRQQRERTASEDRDDEGDSTAWRRLPRSPLRTSHLRAPFERRQVPSWRNLQASCYVVNIEIRGRSCISDNSSDKLRHPRSVAYSVELVLLNKHQISGGGAYLN